MMRSSKRFKGECAAIDATMVANKERTHLDTIGVPHYDYPALALQCAHDPMEVPDRFAAPFVPNEQKGWPSKMVVEYAFSSVIDEAIHNVTTALKAKQMWDNTLFVVSADNGGPAFSDQAAASNFPLR